MKAIHLRRQTRTDKKSMKRKSENLCFSVCDVIVCFLMVVISLSIVVDGEMANDNQKILSRRLRYLIFPEGSSFQVVYETYHPVVDYPNLLIFYLTQALAWELPYDAFHPEEHLQDLLDDVVFPQDQYDDNSDNNMIQNDSQYQYQQQNQGNGNEKINSQNPQNQNANQNQQGVQLQNRNEDPNSNSRNSSRLTDAYYSNSYSTRAPNQYYYPNYQKPSKVSGLMEPLTSVISNKMDYYFSYADKVLGQIANYATQKHTPCRKTDWSTYTESQPSYYQRQQANRRNYAQRQSRNFVHPAFGKRSTDQNITPEEKFNLNFHRTSRQTMYKKIAKFLESGEVNGSECVLKALCETGRQRNADEKPRSFLMEIMRAIFSLPDALDKEFHPVYSQYDQAHNALTDCDRLFPKCKSSLWNKNVILQ